MQPSRDLIILPDAQAIARAGAELFRAKAVEAVGQSGSFRVALSGGSTPKAMFSLLAQDPFVTDIPWDRIDWFWGDERSVPADHPDSNYGAAQGLLLSRVGISPGRVHPLPAWDSSPGAAAAFQKEIAQVFGCDASGPPPSFDLIYLGMGADGHTASLFPWTKALAEKESWVVANEVPQLSTRRMTFTFPLINAAATVCFLVGGADKADPLRQVLEGPPDLERYPSQGVHARGKTIWYLDKSAAAKLTQDRHHA